MVRTKVFVGNLSFKTRDNGLATAFEKAGKVISATIVTRGRGRSLGYGFVEFENEEGANKAVQLLNKKDLDGREINVELAKPRTETPPGAKPEGGNQPRGNLQQGGNRGGNFRGGNFRGGNRNNYGGFNNRRGGGGQSYRPRFDNNQQFRGGNRFARGGFNNRGGARPARKPQEGKKPSPTGLFVTNLPFKFSDEDFAQVFVDAGVKPKSAKVVRNRNNRSKGYGFVEFENTQDQQKGLQVNEKTVAERTLIVKVAMIDGPEQQGQGQQAQGQQAQGQGQQAPQQAQPQAQAQGQQAQQAKPAQPAPGQTPTTPTQGQQAQQAKPATSSPQATTPKEGAKAPSSPATTGSPAKKEEKKAETPKKPETPKEKK